MTLAFLERTCQLLRRMSDVFLQLNSSYLLWHGCDGLPFSASYLQVFEIGGPSTGVYFGIHQVSPVKDVFVSL